MRSGRRRGTWLALVAVTLGTVGLGLAAAGPAQDAKQEAPKGKGKGRGKAKDKDARGGLRLFPGGMPKGDAAKRDDPLANPGQEPAKGQEKGQPQAKGQPQGPPKWPFHYDLKIASGDTPLAARYYPAEKPFESPVLMLLHETGQGRSGRDFEDPIEALNRAGFAQHMQKQGYAVLVLDLRGHGANSRHELGQAEWQSMVGDLQAAYTFLIDRHNRGELNLGKLGVVALGDAGNLAAAWASAPGGAVSGEGRISDLGALVLASPVAEARGLALARILPQIAPRFPLMLISGDRDKTSIEPVRGAQPVVERHRLSKVAYFDTALHATKLLQFFPKVADAIAKFLDDPVKFRTVEWEPRYLLRPAAYADVQLVADSGYQPGPGPGRGAAPAAKGQQPKNAPAQPEAPAANKKAAEKKD
jgi:alpha-beta hydrolase superfamily lysophospholipase